MFLMRSTNSIIQCAFGWLIILSSCATAQNKSSVNINADDNQIIKSLDDKSEEYADVAHQIWTHAELGYIEHKSTKLLQDKLSDVGFEVEAGVADIPTAFAASYGSGKPVIGILAEFDALPGVSQDAVPYRKERQDCKAGHACGHHLFGTASVGAGIAIKEWLSKSGKSAPVMDQSLIACSATFFASIPLLPTINNFFFEDINLFPIDFRIWMRNIPDRGNTQYYQHHSGFSRYGHLAISLADKYRNRQQRSLC